MDFKTPDLSKIIDLNKLEQQVNKQTGPGVDKLAMMKAFAGPMLKQLPSKAKYGIALAIVLLITGAVTVVWQFISLIVYLISLCA